MVTNKSTKTHEEKNPKTSHEKKTLLRASKFTIIGIILALINFGIYTLLARTIFGNSNELLWLDSLISYLLTAIAAYILHSRVTWRERHPSKLGVINFFAWNIITAVIISPLLTLLFSHTTPIYEFIFNFSSNLHLPFDYAFIEATGIFIFTSLVTMVLNFLFYDKLVFGDKVHR